MSITRRNVVLGVAAIAVAAAAPGVEPPKTKTRFLMPAIDFGEIAWNNKTIHDGAYTIRYTVMDVLDFEKMTACRVRVGSDAYQALLLDPELHTPGDVLPHIQFGGGIVAIPGGDPTFYQRWIAHAKTLS